MHLDTVDGGIPVSALVTSASLNDSQVALPLATLTARKITSCYDLMDGFGANKLRVRGHAKAAFHLMFGVRVLAADQLMKLAT